MIIQRYVLKEVLVTTSVIGLVLFLFSLGRRFSQYLAEAARGDIAPDVLAIILFFRMPEFLMLILPTSFFLAILVSYGRLYVDNEMVVLSSCGLSKRRLLFFSLVPAVVVAAITAALTLYLGPLGWSKVQTIEEEQSKRSELSLLSPKRFQDLSDDKFEIYFQSFNQDRKAIRDVFFAETAQDNAPSQRLSIITAAQAEEYIDPDSQRRYLLLRDGYQYIGRPGEPDYQVLRFDTYAQYIKPRKTNLEREPRLEGIPTRTLMTTNQRPYKAELHWRLALPIVVIITTLIAVPMSYTSPRQGRFFKLFPALFLFVMYFALLIVGQARLEEGKIPQRWGLWWVHGIYLAIAIGLLLWNNGQPLGKLWRVKTQADDAREDHAAS